MANELSLADRKAVQMFLDQRREESAWIGWITKKDEKNKIETRILVVGSNRIFSLKPGAKVAREAHYSELQEIKSVKPNELCLAFKEFRIDLTSDRADDILHAVRSSYNVAFPGTPENQKYKLDVQPSSRLRELVTPELPLGGFINTYKSLCDLLPESRVREDIIWDMENLFIPGNVKDFNLKEFEQPITQPELKSLLGALQRNKHFKSLKAKNFPLDKNMVINVADTLRFNTSIEELELERDGITKDGITTICESLTANKQLQLSSVSFAANNLEDKGLTSLGSYLASMNKGLVKLNIAHCNGTKVGMVALCNALKKNPHMSSTLTFFDISNNKLESDGSSAFAAFLANPNSLRSIMMANTFANLEVILSAVTRGCPELRILDLSGNKLTRKDVTVLAKYLQAATALTDLNLCRTELPVDSLKEIVTAIASNPYLKDFKLNLGENRLGSQGARVLASLSDKLVNVTSLDLHDNELGDEGISIVAEGFVHNSAMKHINLDANFKNRSKDKGKHAMDCLIGLISSESSVLESLSLAGGPKSELKLDILPFFYALGTNASLKYLDVSGHQTGNKGAAALGKALQTNETLETLKWDFNLTTAAGFYSFGIGLKRNFSLKNMPLPINDIAAALKGNEAEINALINKIERLILRNQSPTSQFAATGEIGGGGGSSQFGFLSSGQREGVQKLLFKIKASGRKVGEDHKHVMVDAENQDQVMASIFSTKDSVHQQFEYELRNQLVQFVQSCNPTFGKLKNQLIEQILETVKSGFKALDDQTVRRLQTNLAYGGKDLPEDEFERILVGHAHAELCLKANQALHSTVSIASDYLYEKVQEKLQDISDEIAEEIRSEEAKAASKAAVVPPSTPPPSAKPLPTPVAKGSPAAPPKSTPPKKAAPPLPNKANRPNLVLKPGSSEASSASVESLQKVESNLEHATKSRPQVQAKRKPPTRKPRPAPPSATPM